MGTNGNNRDDDLFGDDLADSFFRQGDAGFDDLWADDPAPQPEVAEPKPAAPAPEAAAPAPEPAAPAPEPAAPAPEAAAPAPAPEAAALAPEPAAPAPEPTGPPPSIAALLDAPTLTPGPSSEDETLADPPADATPAEAAAVEAPPPVTSPTPAPVERTPADRAIFSAPTIIMPAGEPLYESTSFDNAPGADDVPAVPEVPEVPGAAGAAPPASASDEPSPHAFGEETLFDTEAGFYSEFGDLGSAEETAELLDAPTQEAPAPGTDAYKDWFGEGAGLGSSDAQGMTGEGIPQDGNLSDDDPVEASADDFVDELGSEPSLVMRRTPSVLPDVPPVAPSLPEAGSDVAESSSAPPAEERVSESTEPASEAEEVLGDTFDGAALSPPPPEVPPLAVPASEEPRFEGGTATAAVLPPPTVGPQLVLPTARPAVEGDDGWAEAVSLLERLGSPDQISEAGRIAFDRLGDAAAAERLLARAVGEAVSDPATLAAYASAVGALGDHQRLRDLLERRASQSVPGAVRAALLQDAALLERHQLGREQAAVALLERSRASAEEHEDVAGAWFALRLLRASHTEAGRWQDLTAVLTAMAEASSGGGAGRLWLELGTIFEEKLEDPRQAAAAYQRALEEGAADALVGAERCLGRQGRVPELAELYEGAAGRTEGADAALWMVHAARAQTDAGNLDAAIQLWRGALDLGLPSTLRHEYQALLQADSRWSELHAALRFEATGSEGRARAWAAAQAARIAEAHLGVADLALEDWAMALEACPDHGPALEAVLRLSVARGDAPRALALLEGRLASTEDANALITLHYRAGEVAQNHIQDLDGAIRHYRQVLNLAPSHLPALDGLEACLTQQADWAAVVTICEQRAGLAEHDRPQAAAAYLTRAAMLSEVHGLGSEAALAHFVGALRHQPSHCTALEGAARIYGSMGDDDSTAALLSAAIEAETDGMQKANLLFRLGRLHALQRDDDDSAYAALRACIDLSPGFRPAAELMGTVARRLGRLEDVHQMARQEADSLPPGRAREWLLLEAANAARGTDTLKESALIQQLLRDDRESPPARLSADVLAIATGDQQARRTLLEDSATTASDAVAFGIAAALANAVGDLDGATQNLTRSLAAGGGAALNTSLAALALKLGQWDASVDLATESGRFADAALIQELRQGDHEAAILSWDQAGPSELAAAARLRMAAAQADRSAQAAAHRMHAEHASAAGARAVHAVLAGHLFAGTSEHDAAVDAFQLALADAPGRGRAFDGLQRLLISSGDTDGLVSHFGDNEELWPGELADALLDAGSLEAAADQLEKLGSDEALSASTRLGALLRLEHVQVERESWQSVLDTIAAQCTLIEDTTVLSELEARQRWILAEKLADSEEAWAQYQRLHEADPSNAEVLEALARIAGTRGETEMAIGFLDQLSSSAPDASTGARYRRRAAQAWLQVGDKEAARRELSAALELDPNNAEVLQQLRDLAADEGDWNAVVGVLSREAAVMEGDDRTSRLRDVARLWEKELADPGVAIDSWRKVLSTVPGDEEALSQLVALSRDVGDWATFAEVAELRLGQLEGREKTELQAELGGIVLRKLYREDEAIRHLDAASVGDHASLQAARDLERIYAGAGLWENVVESIGRQAAASEGAARVACLLRAAKSSVEMLSDREAASDLYGQVLALDPSNAAALRFQADHLFGAGRYEEAVGIFERLEPTFDEVDIDDDDDEVLEVALALYRFAQALEKLGRVDDAILRYERVREITPGHLPSLEGVGPLYLGQKRWKDAAGAYRQLLRLTGGQGDPARLARIYTSLGRIEIELGNLDKAERRFAKALQVRPNDIAALAGSADVLLRRGDDQSGDQQSDTWRRLLTVYNTMIYHAQTPDEVVVAYLTKGFVLDARLGLAEKAALHYQKSLAFDGSQPWVLLRLAEQALRRQDWPDAESLASQGLALDPVPAEAAAGLHLVLYVAFAACGDTSSANEAWQAAQATGSALATALGAEAVGVVEVHNALRERLQARL